MKAMVWYGGEKFIKENLRDPVPQDHQVVVKVDTVGVCGTDVHITQGLFPKSPPMILGHEGSGVIVDVGKNVDKSRIGSRVVMNTTTYCNQCFSCKNWSISRCEKAESTSGMFAEYVVCASQSAVNIPDKLDLEQASLTEPASCCLSGAEMLNVSNAKVGVVVGGGIMGLFTLAFLKNLGVEKMIMSEPVKIRREISKQFGADILHDPKDSELNDFIKDNNNGWGADISVEAVGKPNLVAKCIDVLRPRGQVLMIGVSPQGSHLPVDLYEMHYKEITIKGAFGRGDVFDRTPKEISKLKLDNVISKIYSLDKTHDAINDSSKGKGIKLVIKP